MVLRATVPECREECGDIEEVEVPVLLEVSEGFLVSECREERGDIEEVEVAIACDVSWTRCRQRGNGCELGWMDW